MVALAATAPAISRPKTTNRPTRTSSILLKTEPKSNERYQSRSVHTLVKMANRTTRTAAITRVGRMALRRPPIRTVLKLDSPQISARPSTNATRARTQCCFYNRRRTVEGSPSCPSSPQGMRQSLAEARDEVLTAQQLLRSGEEPGHPVAVARPVGTHDDADLLPVGMGRDVGGSGLGVLRDPALRGRRQERAL